MMNPIDTSQLDITEIKDAPSIQPGPIPATPWWRVPATIPKREFLYRRHYIRRFVGATIGGGGRGKTTLGTTEALSMAVGRDLLGNGLPLASGPLRVWVLNAEEDQDELDRRFAAACQYHGIAEADLGGRLFVQSLRDRPMRLATMVKNVATLNDPILREIRESINTNKIDVTMLDPFISFHSVNESANAEMDLVVKEGLGTIAGETNSAIEIFHHPGKPKPGQETTVEDGRGASAIIWAVRSARVLNFMTTADAEKLGIMEDDRRRHVQITNGKANLGPTGSGSWMKIEVETLPNGDAVACSSSWSPPDPFAGVTLQDTILAQQLAQTGAYRADSRSPRWFGFAVAQRLRINVRYGADNTRQDIARINSIIKIWIRNNVLAIEEREDESRRKRRFIVVGSDPISAPRSQNMSEEADEMVG